MQYPPSKCPKKSGCLISCDLLKQRKIYPRVINLSIIVQPIECFWAPYCKPLAINYQLAEAVFGQLLSDIWDSAISSASRKWSCWEVRLDVLKSLPNHWTTSQNRKNDSDMFPMLYIYMDMDECTNNLWNTYEHECIYFFVFALYHVCVGSHKPHSLQYVTQSCCFEPSLNFFYIYIACDSLNDLIPFATILRLKCNKLQFIWGGLLQWECVYLWTIECDFQLYKIFNRFPELDLLNVLCWFVVKMLCRMGKNPIDTYSIGYMLLIVAIG